MPDLRTFCFEGANGPLNILGYLIPGVPGLAVTQTQGCLWGVTHLPSGFILPGVALPDPDLVRRLVVEHLGGVDWEQPHEALKGLPATKVAWELFADACRATEKPVVSPGFQLYCVTQEREVLVWAESEEAAQEWAGDHETEIDYSDWAWEATPYSYLPGSYTGDSEVYRTDDGGDLTVDQAVKIMEAEGTAPKPRPAPKPIELSHAEIILRYGITEEEVREARDERSQR